MQMGIYQSGCNNTASSIQDNIGIINPAGFNNFSILYGNAVVMKFSDVGDQKFVRFESGCCSSFLLPF